MVAGFDWAPWSEAIRLVESAKSWEQLLVCSIGQALVDLAGLARLARRAHHCCLVAAKRLSSLVAQGFFLPFGVVSLGLVSRLASHAKFFCNRAAVRA